MRFLVKVAPHPLPNRYYFRIVCNSSQPDCFAHRLHASCQRRFTKPSKSPPCLAKSARQGWGTRRSEALSEERHSQQRLPDELAQNIAGWCHDSARVSIAEQAFDAQML